MNEDFIYDYDHEAVMKKTENSIRYEGYEQGIEQGIKEGKLEGSKEKQIEIAKEMLKDNVSIENISKYTNLSIDEIKNLN